MKGDKMKNLKMRFVLIAVFFILSLTLTSSSKDINANLSLEPSRVEPQGTSNLILDIKCSEDIKNIVFASIVIVIPPLINVNRDLFSAKGFMQSAEFTTTDHESEYLIKFSDSTYKWGNTGNLTIPISSNHIGSYNITLEKAIFRDEDHERIAAEVSPPIELECIEEPFDGTMDDENESVENEIIEKTFDGTMDDENESVEDEIIEKTFDGTMDDENESAKDEIIEKTFDTSCIEYDLPKEAYIYTPVMFSANIKKCSEVDSCTLSYINSTRIDEWKNYETIGYNFKELPYGKNKFNFIVWHNGDNTTSYPLEIDIVDLSPLGFSFNVSNGEKYIGEPFDAWVECNNNNKVDIEDVTMKLELPEGIASGSEFGSDFKMINDSLVTAPKDIPHMNKIFWKDIELMGQRNATFYFSPVIDFSYIYNGHLIKGSGKIVDIKIIIKNKENNSPSEPIIGQIYHIYNLIYDFVSNLPLKSWIIVIILGLLGNRLNTVEIVILGELRQGLSLYNKNSNERAFEHFKEALKKNETYFLSNYYCGMIKLKQKNILEAIDYLSVASEFYPPKKFHPRILMLFQRYLQNEPNNNDFSILGLMLHAEEIGNAHDLLNRLRCVKDPVSQHIMNHLNEEIKNMINENNMENIILDENNKKIVNEINIIMFSTQFPNPTQNIEDKSNSVVDDVCIYNYEKNFKANREKLDQAYPGIVTCRVKY
jgi:tetratricopeptide (TPR) repeat protein